VLLAAWTAVSCGFSPSWFTHWSSLQHSPDLLAGFKGQGRSHQRENWTQGNGKEERRRKERENGEGDGCSIFLENNVGNSNHNRQNVTHNATSTTHSLM